MKVIVTAPSDSPAHRKLRELARSATDEDALREFLWLVNAHSDLAALPLVCHNLRAIFAAAEQEWDTSLDDWHVTEWEEVLLWIETERSRLQEEIGGSFDIGFGLRGTHPLMRYGIERYPVYGSLCNSHERDELRPRYRLLQAHLLIAHAQAMRRFTTRGEYERHGGTHELLRNRANPYLAALAVRDLSSTRRQALLESLPVELPPMEFLAALSDTVLLIHSDIRRHRDLVVFLEKALGDRQQGHRNPNSGGRRGAGPQIHGKGDFTPYIEDEIEVDDPDEPHARRITIRKRLRTNRREIRALLHDDISPYENLEDEELDSVHFRDEAFEENPGAFQQAAVTHSNHVSMANQLLPWSYGRLALPELRHLLIDEPERMRSLLSGQQLSPEDAEKLEMLALVHVMFWTGSPLERARRLMLFSDKSSREADLALMLGGKWPRWRIRAPLYDFGMLQREDTGGTARSRTEFLELPDLADGSFWVRQFLVERERAANECRSSGERGGRGPARVFRRRKGWYRVQLGQLLSMAESDSRVTRSRIAQFILDRTMLAAKGDITAAAIITGRGPTLARVRLFYACPSVRRLQMIYCKAAGDIDRELRRLSGSHVQTAARFPEFMSRRIRTRDRTAAAALREAEDCCGIDSGEWYICNRDCPTVSAVRGAVRRIHEDLNQSSRYSNESGFRRYHNLFTLYTCLMFSYSTSVRGVRTPYISPFALDPVHGFAKLTDKDSGTGHKTRLAWIMPALRKQMELYRDFISRSPILPAETDLPVYFLDEEMMPQEVQPRTTLPFLAHLLPYPINIHRRFVSAELLDRGCPPEVVDAWAGHWFRGEEPWGRFSVFTFVEYKLALQSYLVPLLTEEIGFRPVRGFSQVRIRG